MLYNGMDLQLGVWPEMDWEAPGLFTASERILQDFASEKKVNSPFIKDLMVLATAAGS